MLVARRGKDIPLLMRHTPKASLLLGLVGGLAITVCSPALSYGFGTPEKSSTRANCSLSKKGVFQYDGPCQLSTVTKGSLFKYSVNMGEKSTKFTRKGVDFFTKDSAGNKHPVKINERGKKLVFRWGQKKLVVSKNSQGGQRQPSQAEVDTEPSQESVGAAAGTILDYFINK
ncbi:MAG: hypothetical protein AB8B36_08750 [Prochlorococcus sp.]